LNKSNKLKTSKNEEKKQVTIKRALIEVKNVVCSDYSAQYAPVKTGPNHCVIIVPETQNDKDDNDNDDDNKNDIDNNNKNDISKANKEYVRSGIFPWGRVGQTFEGKKVVSERAIKHLRNLSKLNNSTTTSTEDNNNHNTPLQTVVLFVINRSDCQQMRACHEQCPVFATELKSVSEKGTLVISFRTRWTEDGKAYFDGIVPVSL
jgi:NAD-dependent dihydropyrimidine dehydrogenase PreA subunit